MKTKHSSLTSVSGQSFLDHSLWPKGRDGVLGLVRTYVFRFGEENQVSVLTESSVENWLRGLDSDCLVDAPSSNPVFVTWSGDSAKFCHHNDRFRFSLAFTRDEILQPFVVDAEGGQTLHIVRARPVSRLELRKIAKIYPEMRHDIMAEFEAFLSRAAGKSV